ncbi:Endoribonuclease YbeY [Candidatus Hodgkinia cicadicola]|nr:Endoribonuclease YbeY [Candidatus Hodgkinia cicadicola]
MTFEIRCKQWQRARAKLIIITNCLASALARSPTAHRKLKVVFAKRGEARFTNQTIWIGWRARRRSRWSAAHVSLHALGLTDVNAECAVSLLARQRQLLRGCAPFFWFTYHNSGFN